MGAAAVSKTTQRLHAHGYEKKEIDIVHFVQTLHLVWSEQGKTGLYPNI